ncbi:MAG: SDR family NAD(P)-dependent oxidoreductase [Gemmatimonadota bacterium]
MTGRESEPGVGREYRTALVTGASGGIGYELARLLAAQGYGLVIVARSEDLLRTAADELASDYGVPVRVVVLDLEDRAAPDRLFELLQNEACPVEILVNNAGFGTSGAFADTDLGSELRMLQVNVAALTHLSKLFLRQMKERGSGRILNVASTAAFQPGPFMAVYFATKAYVLSLSQAIAEELRGTAITVTALCPGATATGFQRRAAMQDSTIGSQGMMDARVVARAGLEGMMRGERIVIPGARNRFVARAVGLLPRKLVTKVVRRLTEGRSRNGT